MLGFSVEKEASCDRCLGFGSTFAPGHAPELGATLGLGWISETTPDIHSFLLSTNIQKLISTFDIRLKRDEMIPQLDDCNDILCPALAGQIGVLDTVRIRASLH